MDYDPQILRTAPREWRRQLDHSARADRGSRRHSILSLAVELDVYPHRVLDAVRRFQSVIARTEDVDADELDRAAFTGARYGGHFELPAGHPDGPDWMDSYLTDDAIVYVLECIRPPSFATESPVPAYTDRMPV